MLLRDFRADLARSSCVRKVHRTEEQPLVLQARGRRCSVITAQPVSSSRLDIASPMPELAPVTTAVPSMLLLLKRRFRDYIVAR